MRIAITGAAGIGKTTLASALSEQLKLPLIKEDLGEVVQAFNLSRSPAAGGMNRAAQLEACRQACRRWLRNRQDLQEQQPAFVQDRCAIDILQRWLTFDLSGPNNADTLQIIQLCQHLLSTLDWVVIPPFNLTPEKENEDRLVRRSSLSILFRGQSLTVGIAQMLVPEKRLLLLPPKLRSVQERVDFVSARVQKKQGHPGGIAVQP